ncbi:hypothetical protein PG994_014342 [Apiospora phragmitis]|uniref:Uncharacterized protein n=1 Tax=Apiospora phragmitis TaxID=2905665 RepID=A0ABR1T415_9PEZI
MAEDNPTTIPTFTMTPELERLLARGRELHPTWPDDVQMTTTLFGMEVVKYAESLGLPDLDDKRGILRFVGLNDGMIDWALEQYRANFPSDPEELALKFTNVNGDITVEGFQFPLLDRFNSIIMKSHIQEIDELDINYDDYVKGGLVDGLRPEFAIFCGLHPLEKENYEREEHRNYFYTRGCQEHADNIMGEWSAQLELLWAQKLKLEETERKAGRGPAFDDGNGKLEDQVESPRSTINGDDAASTQSA